MKSDMSLSSRELALQLNERFAGKKAEDVLAWFLDRKSVV